MNGPESLVAISIGISVFGMVCLGYMVVKVYQMSERMLGLTAATHLLLRKMHIDMTDIKQILEREAE